MTPIQRVGDLILQSLYDPNDLHEAGITKWVSFTKTTKAL
jgi:hypothetical protein